MKFRGHETFYIRRNWIPKGIVNIIKDPSTFMGSHENPMDTLGIGANMVKSLRYWLQAVGISYEINTGKKVQNLTDFGKVISENDLYLEEEGTLWLLHYKLVSNKSFATTWYYFFNEFSLNEFTKEELESNLKLYGLKNEIEISDRVVEDDISCLLNTYYLKEKKQNPEDNMKCPFDELNLIKIINKKEKIYKKNITDSNAINPFIALAVIAEQSQEKKELKLSALQEINNIGKVFSLDMTGILSILRKLEKLEYLKVIRTAGLDIIKMEKEISFIESVKKYYENINCEG